MFVLGFVLGLIFGVLMALVVWPASDRALAKELRLVRRDIRQMEEQMALDLTALKDSLTGISGAVDSAGALITGMTGKIQELINASGNTVDPAELQAIVDGFNAEKTELAEAVAANPIP